MSPTQNERGATARGTAKATYLVVGAGTAGMSFIDSLLTLDADATVILVDRNSQPGGHWTRAYPFVRLHQAGCNYGVNSLPLAHARDNWGNEPFDINDRATGKEIVEYYEKVAEQFAECGRVEFYFNCEYSKDESGEHVVTNVATEEVTTVSCKKVVLVHSNVVVPSMRDGPPFPIDSSVKFAPVNDLPTRIESQLYKRYIIIGAGKTSCEAINFLLRSGVDQSAITWIISRDVWFLVRDILYRGRKTYREDVYRVLNPLGKAKTLLETFLEYEKEGIVARLDASRPRPKLLKGAIIDTEERARLQSIKDVVRLGRVTRITADSVVLEKGTLPLLSPSDTLFVDCMADFDGKLNGYGNFAEDFEVFEDGKVNLGPIPILFNPSCSSAVIAYIESTFVDDSEMKNSLLYFVRGEKHNKPNPETFLGIGFYMQLKTFKALGTYPPAMKFILNSRTFLDAPCHHHNGLAGFLWASLGPLQLSRIGNEFVEKVESGGYADCQDNFGCAGRQIPERNKLKIKEKSKVKSNYPPQRMTGGITSCFVA